MPAKELQKQLRETLDRYELIFSATNDVLYELDLQSGRVIWNDALYTQYGHDKGNDTEKLEWWTSHVHPDDAMRLENEIENWFGGKQDTWQTEYRFRKADGTYVDVRDRGMLQRDADGSPLRIIGSFLEITREKQLERAKDEFISLVSHQLRTPLTAIRMYSDMLAGGMSGPLSDNQKEQIQHINNASVRLIKLVGEILDISKIEMGHMSSVPEPVDINKFLRAALNEVQPLAVEKAVSIRFKSYRGKGLISLDTTVLGQVVHNLLVNAIRYTQPQKGVVDISFAKNKDGYRLCIKDNGIGILQPVQARVFERFYRADNQVNIQQEGAGLGLYVVKQMAEAAGYEVWLKSTPNDGAAFYVQIPEYK